MRKIPLILMALFVVGLATALFAVLQDDPTVSTLEIDRDRAAVKAEIAATEAESEKYATGVIKVLLDLRVALLRNTAAMLDQKRYSIIRRIALEYTIEGKQFREASDNELNEILADLTQAEKKVAASKAEASRYSGGLMQSMALLKAETDELSVSQLRMKFYSAKHGIPMLIPVESTKSTPEPPKKIVKDREAL